MRIIISRWRVTGEMQVKLQPIKPCMTGPPVTLFEQIKNGCMFSILYVSGITFMMGGVGGF